MIVVSDSSPLITLAAAGHLDLLHALYGRVLVPEAVHREVTGARAELPGAEAVRQAAWVELVVVADRTLVALLEQDVDMGEAEAIALAVERGADLVLLDERPARRRADLLGLRYTGVVGVLLEAKERGLVSAVRPVLDAMRASGFWLSDAVYRQALALVGEGPR